MAATQLSPLAKSEAMTSALLENNFAVAIAEAQVYSMRELTDILKPKFGRRKSTLAAAMLLKGKISIATYKAVVASDNEECSFTS